MSQVKTHATEVQKKTEPVRQAEQEATRQSEQRPVQQVAPQAAYRRAQVNRNGLRAVDVLALQRAVGNRAVQRMMARSNDPAHGQQPGAPSEENPGITVQTKLMVDPINDLQSRVEGQINRGESNKGDLFSIQAQAPAVTTVQRKSDRETGVAKDAANKALNDWELARIQAINRYRDWLTHNMILLLSDVLRSGKGSTAIDKIKGSFAQNVAEQALGNLGALAAVEIGARIGGQKLTRLFLSLRTAKVFGGVVSFVVGAIIEALIGDLLDKTNEIIKSTAEQMDELVTGVVNPIVDSKQGEMTKAIQDLRDGFGEKSMLVKEWLDTTKQIKKATDQVNQIFLNKKDEFLYRQLALISDVYSGKSLLTY